MSAPAATLLRIDGGGRAWQVGFARITAEHWPLGAAARALLHPNELATGEAFPAPRRQRSYLLGRCAAKAALALLLPGRDPAALRVGSGLLDQPLVYGADAGPLDVSISHTDLQACALAFPAALPMGLDVEQVDPGHARTMQSQISPAEWALAGPFGGDAVRFATVLWSAREALSKALRCGLTVPLELLALERLAPSPWGLTGRFCNFGQYALHVWPRADYVLALVLPHNCTLLTDLGPALAEGPRR